MIDQEVYYTGNYFLMDYEYQKYVYKLCDIANVDPLIVFAICIHESSCKFNLVDYRKGYITGIMQLDPGHIKAYANYPDGQYSQYTVVELMNFLEDYLPASDLNILRSEDMFNFFEATPEFINRESTKQYQNILKNPYVNFTFGIAKLYVCYETIDEVSLEQEWEYEENKHELYALKYYCGVTNAEREDIYLRNYLADFIMEELKFEEQYTLL